MTRLAEINSVFPHIEVSVHTEPGGELSPPKTFTTVKEKRTGRMNVNPLFLPFWDRDPKIQDKTRPFV